MIKKYYSTGELADICAVSPTTIFRAIVNKHLKAATTPGGHFRIHKEEAEEFLRKNNIPLPGVRIKTKKVLIVEDNPVEMRMAQRALAQDPEMEIQATSSGYSAGFLTKSYLPDLILLDIFLPDVDGRSVAKLIRSDNTLKNTRIVAISATKDPKDLKEIRSLGLDGFIQKPIAPIDLLNEVRHYLE